MLERTLQIVSGEMKVRGENVHFYPSGVGEERIVSGRETVLLFVSPSCSQDLAPLSEGIHVLILKHWAQRENESMTYPALQMHWSSERSCYHPLCPVRYCVTNQLVMSNKKTQEVSEKQARVEKRSSAVVKHLLKNLKVTLLEEKMGRKQICLHCQ